MSDQLIRYSYGPKAKNPSRMNDWKTKIVSTPVHGFYEMEPSIKVETQEQGTVLAYLLGEPCDGWVHDVYQPIEEPGDGSLIGQSLTLGGAIALAKQWHAEVKSAAAAEKAEAEALAAEADTELADDDDDAVKVIEGLLGMTLDEVGSVTVEIDGQTTAIEPTVETTPTT